LHAAARVRFENKAAQFRARARLQTQRLAAAKSGRDKIPWDLMHIFAFFSAIRFLQKGENCLLDCA
jgi:hypothetical protein